MVGHGEGGHRGRERKHGKGGSARQREDTLGGDGGQRRGSRAQQIGRNRELEQWGLEQECARQREETLAVEGGYTWKEETPAAMVIHGDGGQRRGARAQDIGRNREKRGRDCW
ncbi:hypothetical protein Fot_45399 [Forsythia ovata]|uniref:Uncharacterized protein n=1 Tax=Forsythia ovata TaxID=205694 RepID=A0ABD1R6A5_9LAMI